MPMRPINTFGGSRRFWRAGTAGASASRTGLTVVLRLHLLPCRGLPRAVTPRPLPVAQQPALEDGQNDDDPEQDERDRRPSPPLQALERRRVGQERRRQRGLGGCAAAGEVDLVEHLPRGDQAEGENREQR